MSMNVFEECTIKGREVVITSGNMAGETFKVEGWARDIMAKGPNWASDMGNPAVLNFWLQRPNLLKDAQENMVELMRVGLTGLYGHVGWSGCLVMPEELEVEVDGMSELSAQCDELRQMAESVGLAMPQAATLMMEAADALDSLDLALDSKRIAERRVTELLDENAKLREWAVNHRAELDMGQLYPAMIHAIADRKDAEHQKALDEWKAKDGQTWLKGYAECHAELMEGNEAIAESLEKAGWVELPKDVDGVPIRVGDVMVYADNPTELFTASYIELDKVFGTPYEQMTPAQREEWAMFVREHGYRICETCGGRTGDFCYVNDLVPYTEVRRKHPEKVQRQNWCNGWTNEHVKPW